MARINERNFKAIYSKALNKVTIAYGAKQVMSVNAVSEHFATEGKNGMQIAEMVFEANKKIAVGIVQDYYEARA